MLVITDKQTNPEKAYIYLHIPKCGGTYAKKVIKSTFMSNADNPFFAETGMHDGFNSIQGYRTNNKLAIQGTKHLNKQPESVNIGTITSCALRDPFEWYDSYFYYKKDYESRHHLYREPLIPLSSDDGGYDKALINSLDEKYVEKCSHTVLQQGFCPSIWMKEMDIGFYTAWFLYIIGDHKKIFDNLDKLRGIGLLESDLSLLRDGVENIVLFDIRDMDKMLKNTMSGYFEKEISIESVKKERVTKYNENYIKSNQILSSSKELMDLFLWKERLMFKYFYNIEEI